MRKKPPAPPKAEQAERIADELAPILDRLSAPQREALFHRLRREFPIHPLEKEWNTSAEAILEAIQRSSSLTQRGVRGVLAEASFVAIVLPKVEALGFKETTPTGDIPYDVALKDGSGTVRIQIKLQRSKNGRPMRGNEAPSRLGFAPECFVVETQKTRGGTKDGESTRPYRFGEFDILGVSMYPSTRQWDRFLFTIAAWLLPDEVDPRQILKYQPVPPSPNEAWTDDLAECIERLRGGRKGTVRRDP